MTAKKLAKCLDPNSSLPTDVKFLFKSSRQDGIVTEVRAHKLILAIASDVFEREFFGSLKSEDDIPISDASKEVFQAMIEHIYCKQLNLKDYDPVFIASLYYLAEKYIIEDLRDEIIASVKEIEISRKNVLEVALLAEESALHEPLSEALYNVVVTFLMTAFENSMEKVVKFLSEFEANEKHGLVILKLLKLLVKEIPEKKCLNCQIVPCLNGLGLTPDNFIPGARVSPTGRGTKSVYRLVRKEPYNQFTGACVNGTEIEGRTLEPGYYAYCCY